MSYIDELSRKRNYQREYREKARREARCQQCCKRPVVPGYSRCIVCRPNIGERAPRGVYSHKPVEWCMECLAANFHRTDCNATKEQQCLTGNQ